MKKENGVTLAALIVTVVMMLIVASTTVYTVTNRMKTNNLNKLYNDLILLEDKVSDYYAKYGDLPVLRNDEGKKMKYSQYQYSDSIGIYSSDLNKNDNDNYYIIDLAVLGDITLNYGQGYELYSDTIRTNDLYIINEATHTIYYPKGVQNNKGTTFYSYGKHETMNDTIRTY